MHIVLRAFCPVKIPTEDAKTEYNEYEARTGNAWNTEKQPYCEEKEPTYNAA
jgi:hypothetical protein